MDINSTLNELDKLYEQGRFPEAEPFLLEKYDEAKKTDDNNAALALLNELVGLYRVTTQNEKALDVIDKIKALIKELGLTGSIAEGTSLLNVATVYRAMGKLEDSEKEYLAVEKIYMNALPENDYRMAGFYNNLSLFYQESNKWEKAIECLKKALKIIETIPEASIELAVTHTNLGQAYCHIEEWEEAEKELLCAEEIFTKTDINDPHYGGCANAFGYLYFKIGNYDKAKIYYEKAMDCVYKTYGETDIYNQIKQTIELVEKMKKN